MLARGLASDGAVGERVLQSDRRKNRRRTHWVISTRKRPEHHMLSRVMGFYDECEEEWWEGQRRLVDGV